MTRCLSQILPLSLCALAMACGDNTVMTTPDMGPADSGVEPPDSGVRAKCPLAANNPTCNNVPECFDPGEMLSTVNGCMFCPGFKNEMCLVGQCETPAPIDGNELITLNVDVGALIADLNFLVRMVVDAETSGGETISCDTVAAAPTTFFSDPCYNLTDVRAGRAVGEVGTVFPLPFSRVQAGRKVIFVVYGFAEDNADGTPIGISCTEFDVPPAGSVGMTQQLGATNMTRIQ